MIKAIIFDCFGVLTAESWQKFKDRLPEKEAQEAYELMQLSTLGAISYKEFIAGLVRLSGKSETAVVSELSNEDHKNTTLLGFISNLRTRGFKIGLLSNVGNNWIREEFLTSGEQELFDDMVMSFEVGMNKPDPRIYQLACERLGVKPEEAVFVDDIARYCAAAEAEGMQAIVYTDFATFQSKIEEIIKK